MHRVTESDTTEQPTLSLTFVVGTFDFTTLAFYLITSFIQGCFYNLYYMFLFFLRVFFHNFPTFFSGLFFFAKKKKKVPLKFLVRLVW